MRIKRHKHRKRSYITFLKIALVLSLLCLCINFFYNRVRPMIITAAQNQAKIIVIRALDEAVSDELGKNTISYSDIVTISRDLDGHVTSIETNSVISNIFKTKLVSRVLKELEGVDEQNLSIPSGSLSNIPFLFGKGPKVDFKISTSGITDAEFKSEFFGAGINQTCHRIKLVVSAEIFVLIPGFVTSTTFSTDYYVAETIIVGVTPDFFAEMN